MKHSWLFLLFLLVSCNDYGQLNYITKLPKTLKENSGIAKLSADSLIWFINDSGNKRHIYGVDQQGKLKKDIKLKNAKNVDWEDLTKDDQGNIYIGDFGNNANDRKNLAIYKIPNPGNATANELKAEKIEFYFPEQKKFPPKGKKFFYDAEAFFYHNGHFYLFTRNRSSKFDGTSLCYKIPSVKGKHPAKLIGSLKTCDNHTICQITSADISPDGKRVVLLTHESVWMLSDFLNDDFTNGKLTNLPLGHNSQKESVCFLNDTTLLISDEGSHASGRNLYSFDLK